MSPTDRSGGGTKLTPFEMGEIDLDAGEVFVEFRIEDWQSPFEFSRVADVRLIPLDAIRKLSRPAGDLIGRMGIDKLPDVAALTQESSKLQKQLDFLNKETRRRDFTAFTGFNQFFEFDQRVLQLPEVDGQFKALTRQLNDLRIAKARVATESLARLTPQERAKLDEYFRTPSPKQRRPPGPTQRRNSLLKTLPR